MSFTHNMMGKERAQLVMVPLKNNKTTAAAAVAATSFLICFMYP
jgi:hypothetical protein